MSVVYQNIIKYLKNKENKKFSGAVKLSFENSQLVTLNESNSLDVATDEINQTQVNELLNQALSESFFGSVIFLFENGNLIRGAYFKTFKGDLLKKVLGGANDSL